MKTNQHPRRRAMLMAHVAGPALAAVLFAGAAQAQETPRTFEISAQPLPEALLQFSRQADLDIVAPATLTRGKTAPAVSGAMSSADALNRLLSGSGLRAAPGANGGFILLGQADQAPQGGSAGDVDALIVTAQKREENIQDVPIAISAFSQEDLTRSQIAGGPDLITQVPNMTFTKTNFSSYSIQIRGIGTQAISATTDPAVAVAFNNTPFIRNRFFEQEFYDLDRIEVLRGPQGTLYGRNATAGVVNIISAKPKFYAESKASADVGNYASRRVEAMLNIPLVDDIAALRLAGAWTKRDGYATNEITGNAIDGRDLWSTRLSLRFAPTDGINANLIWEHFEEDDDRLRSGKQLCHRDARTEFGGLTTTYGSYGAHKGGMVNQGCLPSSLYSPDSFEAPNGFSLPFYHPLGSIFLPTVMNFDPYARTVQSHDLRVIESTVDPAYRASTDLVELQFDIDLTDQLTLSSETSYLTDELFSTQDYNRFNTAPGAFNKSAWNSLRPGVLDENGVFCDPQIGCADRLVAVDLSTAKSRQFSQEFRVASDFDGPLNFSLGANFLRYDTEDKYYVFINTLTMYAAISPYAGGPTLPRYVAGVSNNQECLENGYVAADPNDFYFVTGCQYIDPNPIGSLNDQGHNYFLSDNPYKLISYAAFGELYYDIADNMKLTGGLRWTVDKKEAPRIPSWILAGETIGYPVAEVIEQEWREPTGRLTFDWQPDLSFTDQSMLYASFAHGYKAGGANPPAAGIVTYGDAVVSGGLVGQSASAPRTFEAEFINAYEIGAKNTLLDGRVTLNLSAFYYDYSGYQVSYIVNRSAVNLNFDAEVKGVEVEADWRPFDNFRLGFKGGYQDTRIADGARAIDVMDRTAGNPDWIVLRPFPTFASNCIVPLYTVHGGNDRIAFGPNRNVNGNMGYCEQAYVLGNDPVTGTEYKENPTVMKEGNTISTYFPGYIGFDPRTAPNNGEGFYKELGGNELPNAPHFTATITADYTLPLPGDWLATFHTDLYYQSEAWTRVFNTEGYDKLKAYSNINLAAIFTNEDAGWTVMAYVKNVLDRDSITGSFLNSDDTGLTTNVFLTEPRLYGLRVTKQWTGGSALGGLFGDGRGGPGEPALFTLELGGQVQRHDASYETVEPGFAGALSANLNVADQAQHRDLDWGDGRDVKLTYRPTSERSVSLAYRFGRTNGGAGRERGEEAVPEVCGYAGALEFLCPGVIRIGDFFSRWSDIEARSSEAHEVVDFQIGQEIGFGALSRSTLSLGLRYADLDSTTAVDSEAAPDWHLSPGYLVPGLPGTGTRYVSNLQSERSFDGVGPTLSWSAAKRLFGDDQVGHVELDWTVGGGVLFGTQENALTGQEKASYYSMPGIQLVLGTVHVPPISVVPTEVNQTRSDRATVPVAELALGLSYEVQRVKIGAGYRWERYFDAVDAGHGERKTYDRTIDGPYIKIAVGFGG